MTQRSDREKLLQRRRSQAGYTLAELLVVMVILGLLIALVGPMVFNRINGAQTQTAEVQVDSLVTALEYYRLDVGRYPTGGEGLDALLAAPSGAEGWAGPYLERNEIPSDPWGAPYRYELQGGQIRVFSLGSDGQPGGEGDAQDVSAP